MLFQSRHVRGQVAAGQQATVDLGVQGFDAAIKHFRELGDFGHLGHGQAGIGQQFGGAAGREQLHAQAMQGLGKFDNAGLVRYGKKSFHRLVFL